MLQVSSNLIDLRLSNVYASNVQVISMRFPLFKIVQTMNSSLQCDLRKWQLAGVSLKDSIGPIGYQAVLCVQVTVCDNDNAV